ncbi:hypothetical protein OO006_07535 [Prosthecochloris sp. SCSIO W1101]|uniref:hypothetical protein n=1 Tax=Prosthecochloris sp. SCSIO W1101 TaxID=2992242 RepID=UPI00223CEEA3|nr:hypothetical protein [Prosthecochloris sp. SCSIO W1101]UZJ40228.1 hypothetical protein OO006_07535 [Prosthecochloris sp. SCSIO W1101]
MDIKHGENGKMKKEHKYYLSIDIVNREGKRTRYSYNGGADGFSKVLENSGDIFMLTKPIKS